MSSSISKTIVNINGAIGPSTEMKISVLDRGFLFGDSVYEVTRTHNGTPLFLQEHIDRLWQSAASLEIQIQQSPQEIIQEIKKTLDFLNEEHAYFRLIITRGEGDIGLDPSLAKSNNFVIIAKAFHHNPAWWYQKGVNLIIPNIERTGRRSVDPNIKSGNYLNNVLAYMQAKKANAYDALMLNAAGNITEGTTNNIWFEKDQVLYTPELSVGLLKGITRDKILTLAKKLNIKVIEGVFKPRQLFAASEAFLTSSTREIVPVIKIDDHVIGAGVPGPFGKKLLNAYRDYLEQHIKNNQDWFQSYLKLS